MEIIQELFSYISSLGNYVLVPIMIMLVGFAVRLKPIKAVRAGVIVGIGLIGMDLVLGLVWTNISPVAELLTERFGLNLTTIDAGWGAAAGLAFSTPVGSFIIPFIIVVNILLLTLRLTRTMNIDIWNYWHYAFSGAVIYMLTNNIVYGFIAAATHCIIALIIADRTAKQVQSEMGLPGLSIPQGYAVSTVPVIVGLEKIYNIIFKNEDKKEKTRTSSLQQNDLLNTLKEPLFLGLIVGILLGIAVGYKFNEVLSLGMSMAALLFLLPRMIKVLMEGLLPISDATRDFMAKRYAGQEVYVGMDSAILLGHPTTVLVGLLLIPITLLLAMILPWNTTLPVGDLAATAFFVSMASVLHKGKFWRVLISGTLTMVVVLSIASFFAPQITQFAASGSVAIPEGAVQITALSAGNLITFIMYWIFNLGIAGVAVVVALIAVLLVWHRRFLSRQTKE